MTAAAGGEPQPPVALYVHVPFCLSVCPYCDFVVYAGKAARGPANRVAEYLAALLAELRLRSADDGRRFGRRPTLASVYVGGGTPSLLTPQQLGQLLAQIGDGYALAAGAEVTLEVNPGAADRGHLAGFRAAGVNRLSIGAQSMEPAELRRLGRRHAASDIRTTIGEARAAGFDNLSLDLLYDVPGQTLESWRRTLTAVLTLEPEHVSAYALTLDGGDATADHLAPSSGALRWRRRARPAQDEDRAADMYQLADELLAGAGLGWYEISNWARPGLESRHNLAYWRWLPYAAVGPGAHAFDGAFRRSWNAGRLDSYLAALVSRPAGRPPGGTDVLDPATALAERAMLALRTRDGLPVEDCRLPRFAPALGWARTAGLLEESDAGGLRLSLAGRLLASEVFRRLLPEALAEAG